MRNSKMLKKMVKMLMGRMVKTDKTLMVRTDRMAKMLMVKVPTAKV